MSLGCSICLIVTGIVGTVVTVVLINETILARWPDHGNRTSTTTSSTTGLLDALNLDDSVTTLAQARTTMNATIST